MRNKNKIRTLTFQIYACEVFQMILQQQSHGQIWKKTRPTEILGTTFLEKSRRRKLNSNYMKECYWICRFLLKENQAIQSLTSKRVRGV